MQILVILECFVWDQAKRIVILILRRQLTSSFNKSISDAQLQTYLLAQTRFIIVFNCSVLRYHKNPMRYERRRNWHTKKVDARRYFLSTTGLTSILCFLSLSSSNNLYHLLVPATEPREICSIFLKIVVFLVKTISWTWFQWWFVELEDIWAKRFPILLIVELSLRIFETLSALLPS